VTDDTRGDGSGEGFLGTAPPADEARPDTPGRLTLVWRLFTSVLRKEATTTIRYGTNFLLGQLGFLLVLVGIVVGGRRVAGPSFGDQLGGVVVGYFVFFVAQTAFGAASGIVTKEAQWGTLERLYLSPVGFGSVLGATVVADLLWSSLQILVHLLFALLITGQTLVIDPLTVVPLVLLAAAPFLGVGLAVGGVALVVKRLESAMTLFTFVLVGLIAVPVEQFPVVRALPVVQANDMLGRAMREGVRLWEFPLVDHVILLTVGVGYLLAGAAVFRLFLGRARRDGTLGDY
jgi:ABC-2 type transport system permease protein